MHFGQHLGAHVGQHFGGIGYLAYGVDGAATFVLSLQSGATIALGWSTDIITSYSGAESRASPFGQPRRRFEGVAFLLDGSSRDARGALMRSAASGATFLLALPMEELSLVANSTLATVYVTSTLRADWAMPGQRVAVVSPDGIASMAVIQSVTETSLVLNVALGAAARAGGRIMPLVQVLLDAAQGFARYPVAVDLWTLRAQASVFGWSGVDSMGRGAELLQFRDGLTAVEDLADDDLVIWDRPNAIDGTASESMLSGAEVIDLGGAPMGVGGWDSSAWSRSLKLRSNDRADWAWFKALVRRMRGRQGVFLLSTNRDDLLYVATVAGGVVVQSASVAGAGDYVSWFASRAHRRLAIQLTSGEIQYVEVAGVVDNLDGTLTLSFANDGIAGAVARISLLEQVRFDRDDLEVTWTGEGFAIDEVVRVAADVIETPPRNMFDTVLSVALVNNIYFDHHAITLDLGATTFVDFSIENAFGFPSSTAALGALTASGGNVDGMVVCLSAPDYGGIQTIHEDPLFVATSRFLDPGSFASSSGLNGRLLYRYNGTLQRWLRIGRG